MKTAKGEITEIFIEGGLGGPGIAIRAQIVGGQCFEGEAGEDLDAFRTRIRAIAETEGAKFLVFGGLPPNPAEWSVPPGIEEALEKAGRSGVDELDV